MMYHGMLRMMARTFMVCVLGFAGACRGLQAAGAIPAVDPRAWEELDIIPMPKEIRLTDDDLEMKPEAVVLLLGEEPAEQSRIGAEWINRRSAALGGAPLPLTADDRATAGAVALIIGTVHDNPLIARAVRNGLLDIGDGNPGERGYVIRRSADGTHIFLAGADDLGTLYACVTFGELLQRKDARLFWRAAEVRDWPDLMYVTMGAAALGSTTSPELSDAFRAIRNHLHNHTTPPPAHVERYYQALHAYHEQLLRWKITVLKYDIRWNV